MPPFLESNFVTAFAGAISGALSAAWLASSARTRERKLDEMRSCNVAIAQCLAVGNSVLNLKSKCIEPMRERYEMLRGDYLLSMLYPLPAAPNGSIPVVRFALDLEMFSGEWTGIDALSLIITDRILTKAIAFVALAELVQAHKRLQASVVSRNQQCSEIARAQLQSQATTLAAAPPLVIQAYLGLPQPSGVTDTRYQNTVAQMSKYSSDCLYFCELLLEMLVNHARRLATDLSLNETFISDGRLVGDAYLHMMPRRSEYPSFEAIFRNKDDIVVVM